MTCRIVSLDVTEDCAAAKVEISKDGRLVYTDYLTLLKFRDGWKIVQTSITNIIRMEN